jgi:hypothetical protein
MSCITFAVIAGVCLMVLMFLVAFVLSTSPVWGGMLLLACLGAAWLAGAVARSLPTEERTIQTVVIQGKRGPRTVPDPASLNAHLPTFPILFLAMAPSLAYGIVVGCLMASQTPPGTSADLILAVAAVGAGAVVSVFAARKVLRVRLGGLLQEGVTGHEPRDWSRHAGYAGLCLGALLVLGGAGAAWHSSTLAPVAAEVQPAAGVAPASPGATPAPPDNRDDTLGSPQVAQEQSEEQSGLWPGEHFPQTRTGYLTAADIQGWSYSGVRYALNEIYARHGFPFQEEPLRRQFGRFSWYRPVPGLSSDGAKSLFTPVEKANELVLARRRDALTAEGKAIR